MLESLLDGLLMLLQWPAFGYLLLGTIVGLWLGAVPGLGGIVGMVVVMPFTFGMDPISAFAILLSIYAVTTTGDTIASVMLGVPGTAASQATILDGYPLAKRGEAARAFGAAFTVSAIGGVLGGIALAVSLPIALPIILSFGSPEFFLLGILGLMMVGTVSGASPSKGIVAALIGLMLTQIGYPVASEVPRYWFDVQYLIEGLPLIPVVLGLFAIPELLDLAVRNTSISSVPREQGAGLVEGIKDAFRHRWLMIRCSLIGIYIGMLPGLGASISDWVAYGHAVQSTKSRDNPRFGDGDIRGVIAPESANNAVKGGTLIPTVAIGIPGNASSALLLGALLIQGIVPGRDMLTTHLNITFVLVWALIIANIIGSGLLMLWSRQVAKVSFIDGHLIVPGVIIFIYMGAWLTTPDPLNLVTLFALGLLGFLMKRCGWPRPPLVLGFVLGPIMENALVLSMQRYSVVEALSRPATIILIVLIVVALFFAVRGTRRVQRLGHLSEMAEGATQNPLLSLPLAAALLAVFVGAIFPALGWPHSARLFPLTIAATAVPLLVFVITRDGFALARRIAEQHLAGFVAVFRDAFGGDYFPRAVHFLVWQIAILALVPILGHHLTLLGFVMLYLVIWGRIRWYWAATYTAVSAAILYLLYDRALHVPWIYPFFMS